MYAGTRLGRQELDGVLLEDFEGALWSRALIEKARTPDVFARRRGDAERQDGPSRDETPFQEPRAEGASPGDGDPQGPSAPPRLRANHPSLSRIVISLDPPASTGGDCCGLIVFGMDTDGVAYVLADLTAAGLSAEAWARRVPEAAAQFGARRVVAEKNQGGDMIASVLRAVDANLPVRLVPAMRSKAARAEPIAVRFETGRAKLAGVFDELEDQMCALTWTGFQGAGSPDRVNAMVWAMTKLFEREGVGPRVRGL